MTCLILFILQNSSWHLREHILNKLSLRDDDGTDKRDMLQRYSELEVRKVIRYFIKDELGGDPAALSSRLGISLTDFPMKSLVYQSLQLPQKTSRKEVLADRIKFQPLPMHVENISFPVMKTKSMLSSAILLHKRTIEFAPTKLVSGTHPPQRPAVLNSAHYTTAAVSALTRKPVPLMPLSLTEHAPQVKVDRDYLSPQRVYLANTSPHREYLADNKLSSLSLHTTRQGISVSRRANWLNARLPVPPSLPRYSPQVKALEEYLASRPDRQALQIILSLTTQAHRIKNAERTFAALVSQCKFPQCRIIVSIPSNASTNQQRMSLAEASQAAAEHFEPPVWAEKVEFREILFRHSWIDYGPMTKLFGALEWLLECASPEVCARVSLCTYMQLMQHAQSYCMFECIVQYRKWAKSADEVKVHCILKSKESQESFVFIKYLWCKGVWTREHS